MKDSSEASRERILSVATRIFARKGFSGARVDEIAKAAKVNKALIYYYFKSKEAILRELFHTFFKESTDRLLRFVERGGFGEDAEENKKLFEREYESYLEANSDLLKVLFMESLKDDNDETPLFRLVDLGGNDQNGRVEKINSDTAMSEEEMQQVMVTEFFTGVLPFVAYIIFKDKWCNHFKVPQEKLKKLFDRAMQDTHEQYHIKERKGKTW